MKVIETPEHGFCFGVKRSIDLANKVVQEAESPVYTYGPIIHNPQVVEELRKQGVIPIDSFDGIPVGKLIIRSHGVSISVIEEAEKLGFSVIDATCPFVKRAQEYAKKLRSEGYKVIIVGEREHPEVQGILGHIKGQAEVINELSSLNKFRKKKIGVVAQTTILPQKFKNIIGELLIKADEVRVYNTICKDVVSRQQHTVELAQKVDLMIVVGGRNSANTRRLEELATQYCVTYHIETESEIEGVWFKGKSRVGVTAGASTPAWIIDEVVKKIKTIDLRLEPALHINYMRG